MTRQVVYVFFSKDEATNFNSVIVNIDNFESFKYKAKLIGNTVAQATVNANYRILENATITVSLKSLINLIIRNF